MLHTKVVVLQINVEVLDDEFIFDELPDDASHFVAIKFNDWVHYLDLAHTVLLLSRA